MPESSEQRYPRPKPAKNFLRRLTREFSVRNQLHQRVTSLLPPELRPHCLYASLQGDQLTLFADSPVWASRLRYAVPTILSNVRQDNLARRILVRVLQHHTPHQARPQIRQRKKTNLQTRRLLRDLAASIDHPQLSESLQRLADRLDEAG